MTRYPYRKKIKKKSKKKTKKISLSDAQRVFNRWIRERDSEDGFFECIACGKTLPVEKMNAGHFIPVSMSSFLRFHVWNTNGECAGCNGFDQTHLIGYHKRLIEKIGEPAVDWLIENKRTKAKYTQSDLAEIIEKYKM